MATKDLFSEITVKNALDLQTISSDTTTVGEIIDTQFHESATFIFRTGTVTDGDYLPLLEEGDDSGLSDAAAVADADLLGTEAGAGFVLDTDDNKVSKLGYIGDKRFVRLSIVSTNTTSGALVAAQAILSNKRHEPDRTQVQ